MSETQSEGRIAELIGALEQKIAEAEQAIEREVSERHAAEKEKLAAVEERKKAEAAKTEAEAERKRAARVVALMRKRAQLEIDRATYEMEFKAKQRQTMNEMTNGHEAAGNAFDTEAELIEGELFEEYPEILARIQELQAKEGGNE